MKLIKSIIKQIAIAEDAAGGAVGGGGGVGGAVGAHAVAGHAMPLFAKLTSRDNPKKVRITRVKKEKKPVKGLGIKEAFSTIFEFNNQDQTPGGDTYDTTEVVAKLKSLENKEDVKMNDTQAFALEDDEGNLVKVRVRAEQAPNFEAALNAFLSQQENDEDKRGVPEIAELLFKLKDRFDIVDVEWPEVQEDQEEAVDLQAQGAEGEAGAEGGEQLDVGAEGAEGAVDLDVDVGGGGGEEDTKSLLVQVIDMMKADAEARKAEARAREAEAKAKESDIATQQTYAKVKQEEQMLDMEEYNKGKKEQEREAKRLAQLARWKSDMEKDEGMSFDQVPQPGSPEGMGGGMGGREEEESTYRRPAIMKPQKTTKTPRLSGRVAPADVARFILSRVK